MTGEKWMVEAELGGAIMESETGSEAAIAESLPSPPIRLPTLNLG